MSKRTRTLLLAGIAVVVLAAMLVVLLLLPQPDEDTDGGTTTTTAPDTSVTLLDKITGENEEEITVTKVTITYGDESYSLSANDDGDLLLDNYKDLPHNSSKQSSLSSELESIVADRLIAEAPDNPQDYGFDTETGATATVSATYSDGSTYAFELGGEAPSGDGRYLREQGKTAVYLYDSYAAEVFLQKEFTYLSKSPLTTPSAKDGDEYANDTVVLRDAELSGSVRDKTIFFQVADNTANENGLLFGYVIQKPYYRGVNSNSSVVEYTTFSSLTASDIAMVNPTAADLKACGFNTPYSQATFNLAVQHSETSTDDEGNEATTISYYNVFKYTVKLGDKNEDGLRYMVVYAEDELFPIVYLISESGVAWANVQYDDIADSLLFLMYITDVEQMTVNVNGVETVFDLEHIEDEDDRDKNLIVTAGGKTYDTPGFREIYQGLMSLTRSGSTQEVPDVEPTLTLKMIANKDGVRNVDLAIYRQSGSKYVVKHSGGEIYQINAKEVESFLTTYQQYLDQ